MNTGAAQLCFASVLRDVKSANVYVRLALGKEEVQAKKRIHEPLIASSAGLLPRDLAGGTGTHRGLPEKESWN
jgi:hypothetical protein